MPRNARVILVRWPIRSLSDPRAGGGDEWLIGFSESFADGIGSCQVDGTALMDLGEVMDEGEVDHPVSFLRGGSQGVEIVQGAVMRLDAGDLEILGALRGTEQDLERCARQIANLESHSCR